MIWPPDISGIYELDQNEVGSSPGKSLIADSELQEMLSWPCDEYHLSRQVPFVSEAYETLVSSRPNEGFEIQHECAT